MTELKPCPFCGGKKGYFSRHKFIQYYNLAGEPDGYAFVEVTTNKVRCVVCEKVINLSRIREMNRRADNDR